MSKKKTPLYNPLGYDFTVKYDINGDGQSVPFTIHAGEIEYFDEIIYPHIKKHLATQIMNDRGVKGGNVEATLKEINKEIEVNV